MTTNNQTMPNTDAANNTELEAMIAALRAENASLKASKSHAITLKVSEKGGISLYGLGKWPVTLYGEQWASLIKAVPAIEAFMTAHSKELKTKADKVKAVTPIAGVPIVGAF